MVVADIELTAEAWVVVVAAEVVVAAGVVVGVTQEFISEDPAGLVVPEGHAITGHESTTPFVPTEHTALATLYVFGQ